MSDIVNIIGGRKAAACLTGLIVIVGCFIMKGSIPDQLLEGVKYLVSTYLAGNIASDVVQGITSVKQAAASAPTQDPELQAQVIQLAQNVNTLGQMVQTQDLTIKQLVAVVSPPST